MRRAHPLPADHRCPPTIPQFVALRSHSPPILPCLVPSAELWTAPGLLRTAFDYSDTPFPGGTPNGYPPVTTNILFNYSSNESWQWFTVLGQVSCYKGTAGGTDAVCVGANLSLNSTKVAGGQPVYSWVGFEEAKPDNPQACWHELLINSKEATDPARWLQATSQCTRQGQGGYPTSDILSLTFFDYSTAPFPPGIFDLPSACPK